MCSPGDAIARCSRAAEWECDPPRPGANCVRYRAQHNAATTGSVHLRSGRACNSELGVDLSIGRALGSRCVSLSSFGRQDLGCADGQSRNIFKRGTMTELDFNFNKANKRVYSCGISESGMAWWQRWGDLDGR